MNVSKIMGEVERLHATAKLFKVLKIKGTVYTLEFNGRNYVAYQAGSEIAEFNTRSIGQAQTWLRDYLKN